MSIVTLPQPFLPSTFPSLVNGNSSLPSFSIVFGDILNCSFTSKTLSINSAGSVLKIHGEVSCFLIPPSFPLWAEYAHHPYCLHPLIISLFPHAFPYHSLTSLTPLQSPQQVFEKASHILLFKSATIMSTFTRRGNSLRLSKQSYHQLMVEKEWLKPNSFWIQSPHSQS